MSAFVVSDKTMHRVVKAMDGDKNSSCDHLDILGRQLYALNVEAVCQRYGKSIKGDELAEYERLVSGYRYSPVFPSTGQLYKSLGCLCYQCSEGHVPEMALYKEMVEVQNQLAHAIASNSKEYANAEYD